MSKRSSGTRSTGRPSNPVPWEGAGQGLDAGPILYPVLSENPTELLAAIDALRLSRDDNAVAQAVAPTAPRPARAAAAAGYPSLAEIEVERRKLAEQGRPHGYDALGGKHGVFRGQRSTIRRRYEGRPSPGTPIPGVCDRVPGHSHPATPST
jgi:hypothetical protein